MDQQELSALIGHLTVPALFRDQEGRPVLPSHELIAPHSMQVVCLSAGDRLVVHTEKHLCEAQRLRLVSMIRDWAGVDVRVLVMDGGLQLGVVCMPDADAAHDGEA